MRIVYDDAMQRTVVKLVDDFMSRLRLNMKQVVKYDYGMERVQRVEVKARLNEFLKHQYMEVGNTVTHAHGIGNNCQYPVYYHAENEIQQCANININSGMYGEVYVSVEDYNGKRVSKSYELTRHGITVLR